MNEIEKEKEQIFKELQAEINQTVADMEQGIFYTREDLNKRYGLSLDSTNQVLILTNKLIYR